MAFQLDLFDLCRNFLLDNTNWLPEKEGALVLGLIRARDHASLSKLASDPRVNVTSARSRKFYLQVEAFFKKCEDLRDEDVTRPAAISSFERGERICRIANKRLDYYYVHPDRLDPELLLLVERAARFIERALGDFETFMNSIPQFIKITSGATATTPRKQSVPSMKLSRTIDCCPGTVPYARALADHYGLSGLAKFRPIPWNRVEFVPKNWKTDRTIACEPTGSLPFQLAFDGYVKRRLVKYGVDLSDQSRNQRHAKEGSLSDQICTVDLSMASDTVAYNTVAWLLPRPWFDYLRAHRSSCYHHPVDGSVQKYAKFSSMGNGATFALETLIFLSFVRAAGCDYGLVYGDDITIHRDHVDNLFKLLRFFGFVPNVEKSFTSGPFRESCGEHYHNGISVTPFYVRTTAGWNKPAMCHNVNGLAAISEHGELWNYLGDFVTRNRLPLVPVSSDTLSGVHLHPHHAYRKKLISRTKRNGVVCRGGSLSARCLVLKGRTHHIYDSRSCLLWHMRANPSNVNMDDFSPLLVRKRLWVGPSNLKAFLHSVYALTSTSGYTSSTGKFTVRWMTWHPPGCLGVPGYLYGFSDFIADYSAM